MPERLGCKVWRLNRNDPEGYAPPPPRPRPSSFPSGPSPHRNSSDHLSIQVAYEWLKTSTPEDARVMAWWDYGYQITGIGNRTSIADGNTWNHEHIATLARCLVLPEKRAYKIIRHLTDYMLVWAGGRGDDLAKSPHMCRIGTSVYPDISPNDPTCRQFGFHQDRTPTPMMAKSVVYKLCSHGKTPGVSVNPAYFKEVFSPLATPCLTPSLPVSLPLPVAGNRKADRHKVRQQPHKRPLGRWLVQRITCSAPTPTPTSTAIPTPNSLPPSFPRLFHQLTCW